MEHNHNKIIWAVIIVLGGTVILFAGKYFDTRDTIREIRRELDVLRSSWTQARVVQEDVLRFTELFITGVLQAEEEVDFETRLELEQSVRELEDDEIFALWQALIDSTTEDESQKNVARLLEILISKMRSERVPR